MSTVLTENDLAQLQKLGVTEANLENQLKSFRDGVEPINLVATAVIDHGIKKMSNVEVSKYKTVFAQNLNKVEIMRFVPASGAASRMFKSFHKYLEDGEVNDEVKTFSDGFKSFAFYDKIKCSAEPEYTCAIQNMINTIKLSELPKALIPFHLYNDGSRTAFEEHLIESAQVLKGKQIIDIHFTISAAHEVKFKSIIEEKLDSIEEDYQCKFNITFSQQLHSTDTVGVTEGNDIFRHEDGSMLFRPGGHGSLLLNLDNLDSELVFIKNIDNIQINHLRQATIDYKQILAGYLIDLQDQLKLAHQKLSKGVLDGIAKFAVNELMCQLDDNFDKMPHADQVSYLTGLLNRPMRICGMVKNEGEPGGGPFWTKNSKGHTSLQIVESSQMDLSNASQNDILIGSTHFNPVDLVCWIKDKDGKRFNLKEYVDPGTAFISEKSQKGETLKVLEHPGLWNGSMADWITIFVEVPMATFSPVKTINDLLRPQHQPV